MKWVLSIYEQLLLWIFNYLSSASGLSKLRCWKSEFGCKVDLWLSAGLWRMCWLSWVNRQPQFWTLVTPLCKPVRTFCADRCKLWTRQTGADRLTMQTVPYADYNGQTKLSFLPFCHSILITFSTYIPWSHAVCEKYAPYFRTRVGTCTPPPPGLVLETVVMCPFSLRCSIILLFVNLPLKT